MVSPGAAESIARWIWYESSMPSLGMAENVETEITAINWRDSSDSIAWKRVARRRLRERILAVGRTVMGGTPRCIHPTVLRTLHTFTRGRLRMACARLRFNTGWGLEHQADVVDA